MSKYKLVYIFTILAFVAISNPVLAMPAFSNAGLSTPGTDRTLVLPEAAENGHVISLGNAVDPGTGQVVEGYAIVRYKEGFHHRPDHAGGPGGNGGGGGNDDGGDTTKSSCYEFLARDAKWRSVESWEVSSADPSAPVAASTMLSQMSTDIAKWEDATDGSMDGSAGYDILGEGSLVNEVLVADTESPDNRNEVYFADIAEPGAIGVTIVWGVFSGPPFNRELVEWDMVFDDVDFNWSTTGDVNAMDFESISTHELGHAVGLADLYTSDCSEETMYGYATEGETKKRDLNSGDITGMSKLY